MPKAIISVTDKSGVLPLAEVLVRAGYGVLSTGGTAAHLQEANVDVQKIEDFTESPEMLGGRVKTLHPKVFGGILAQQPIDQAELEQHGIDSISIVVVNLYDFEGAILAGNASASDAVEAIDIGGVSLIRAAAKNHDHVLVVVDPEDYAEVIKRVNNDEIDTEYRRAMAAKAFRYTASYDAIIAHHFSTGEKFPERLTLTFQHSETMRYGENPHQDAAFYDNVLNPLDFEQLCGKQLSYNNISDLDAAIACVSGLLGSACAIVKHTNPCGLAKGRSLMDAYDRAFKCDPSSAYGGIIAFNRHVSNDTLTHVIENQFAEVVVAPSFDSSIDKVARRRRNLRLVVLSHDDKANSVLSARTTSTGLLVQDHDVLETDPKKWSVATRRAPTQKETRDLQFAWYAAKHVKSNAIVFAQHNATTGIGAGQMNRLLSVRIASQRMEAEGLSSPPSVMASDAFFPFRDGIDEAALAGITAVIQPGGSIRDDEVIEAANEHDMAMVLTGERHFKH